MIEGNNTLGTNEGNKKKRKGRPSKNKHTTLARSEEIRDGMQKVNESGHVNRVSEDNEAECTWHVGKIVGLRSTDDEKVIQHLTRSQRKAKGSL